MDIGFDGGESSVCDDAGDYLQDPELWEDQLPQPYRMIDHLLNSMLDNTWQQIEQSEIHNQQATAQVQVPEGTSGWPWCRDVLTTSHGGVCAGRGVVFVGNGKNVLVMGCGSDTDGDVIAEHRVQQKVVSIAARQWDDIHVVVTQHNTEIKVLGFTQNVFTEVAGFPHQFKDCIVKMTLSATFSHVAITYSTNENEVKLAVYMLPVESWLSELPHERDAGSQASVASGKKGTPHNEEPTFSKPALLYTLSTPTPLGPCVAANPYTIFQSVSEQAGITVPSGELHSLTNLYLENRRRRFVSKRQHFVASSLETDLPTTAQFNQQPTCHFLHYANNFKQAAACEVAVWWAESPHLSVYPLQEPPAKSGVVLPSRLLPQASPILCSTASEDSSLLALALQSGVVVVWDMRINLCTRVCSCVESPHMISALKFSHAATRLGLGTAQGSVLVLDASMNSHTPPVALSARKEMEEVYKEMVSRGCNIRSKVLWFEINPHLPSLLTSVHADGTLILWNPALEEAVCMFSLATPVCPTSFTFSDNGQHIFTTGTLPEEGGCNVLHYDLSPVVALDGYWEAPPTPSLSPVSSEANSQREVPQHGDRNTHSLLELAETHMKNYVRLRLLGAKENSVKWHKNWKELPNRLNLGRSSSGHCPHITS